MRSKYLPPQHFPSSNRETAFDAMDIDLDINMGEQGPSGSGSSVDGANDLSMDWEQWGEDCTIDLTLVQFDFNGSMISACLSSSPSWIYELILDRLIWKTYTTYLQTRIATDRHQILCCSTRNSNCISHHF